MNFLGIGPGEIVLILIVLLVVVGPERLPALSRQAGRLLVRGRDWFQNKPEMEMMLRARQELEGELAALRAGLREVQLVRDEVMGATRQLTDAVNPLVSARPNFIELLNPKPEAPPDAAAPDALVAPDAPAALDDPPVGAGILLESTAAPEPMIMLPVNQLETLGIQIQAVMEDLRALQQQLQRQGLLSDDWTPPSHGVSLPDQPPAPPASQPEEVD